MVEVVLSSFLSFYPALCGGVALDFCSCEESHSGVSQIHCSRKSTDLIYIRWESLLMFLKAKREIEEEEDKCHHSVESCCWSFLQPPRRPVSPCIPQELRFTLTEQWPLVSLKEGPSSVLNMCWEKLAVLIRR